MQTVGGRIPPWQSKAGAFASTEGGLEAASCPRRYSPHWTSWEERRRQDGAYSLTLHHGNKTPSDLRLQHISQLAQPILTAGGMADSDGGGHESPRRIPRGVPSSSRRPQPAKSLLGFSDLWGYALGGVFLGFLDLPGQPTLLVGGVSLLEVLSCPEPASCLDLQHEVPLVGTNSGAILVPFMSPIFFSHKH